MAFGIDDAGGTGTEYGASYGSGGGGCGTYNTTPAGSGGSYAAGGGGAQKTTSVTSGAGFQGLIVLTYFPSTNQGNFFLFF